MPHFEITEVVLVHHNTVKNDHHQNSRVLHTFVPNKLFGQLLVTSPKYSFKKIDLEFLYIKVWFTDQNSRQLETKDKIAINLISNFCVAYKKRWVQLNLGNLFLFLAKKHG